MFVEHVDYRRVKQTDDRSLIIYFKFVKVYSVVFVPFIELRLDLFQITNITLTKK